nr:DUF6612 family protein [Propionicimonas sp.]
MTTKSFLIGLVAGLSLFSACSTAAPPAATTPGTSAPAATTSAPAGGGVAADDVIGRIAAAGAGVKTYSMDMDMTMALMGEETTITMAGVIDQTDPANVKLSSDMEFAGMKMKMLQVDGEMYMQMDAAGDSWMKVPADQMSQYEASMNSMDLGARLQEVKDSVKQVENLGEETVDGVRTTHHRLTIDASALTKMTGSEGEIDADAFSYDVWVDEADLVRKVAMDLKAKIEGKSLPITVNGTMSHYNEPVTIKAPPKDKIVDMPS